MTSARHSYTYGQLMDAVDRAIGRSNSLRDWDDWDGRKRHCCPQLQPRRDVAADCRRRRGHDHEHDQTDGTYCSIRMGTREDRAIKEPFLITMKEN